LERILVALSCPYPCTDDTILHQNATHAVYILTPLYSRHTLLHVLALKGPSSGNTFCEQGQQNAYPDVDIRWKSSVLYVTRQLSNCDTRHPCCCL